MQGSSNTPSEQLFIVPLVQILNPLVGTKVIPAHSELVLWPQDKSYYWSNSHSQCYNGPLDTAQQPQRPLFCPARPVTHSHRLY